jgi:nucleotide-binding universal stress UspA family protein
MLIAVDDSAAAARALEYIVGLARRTTLDSVVLVNVQPEVHSGLVTRFLSRAQIETALRSWGEDALQPARARLTAAAVPHVARIEVGRPGERIAAAATEERCDEIVMGARGMAAVGSFALGSVAADVVARTRLPVTLLRDAPLPAGIFRKVLLALDGSAPAVRAAAYVADRARALGEVEVIALHVQAAPEHWLGAPDDDAVRKRRMEDADALCGEALAALSRAGIGPAFELRIGDPARSIAAAAAERGCDAIVMGTRGLGSLGGLVLGSVAFKCLHVAGVPVTLVK